MAPQVIPSNLGMFSEHWSWAQVWDRIRQSASNIILLMSEASHGSHMIWRDAETTPSMMISQDLLHVSKFKVQSVYCPGYIRKQNLASTAKVSRLRTSAAVSPHITEETRYSSEQPCPNHMFGLWSSSPSDPKCHLRSWDARPGSW